MSHWRTSEATAPAPAGEPENGRLPPSVAARLDGTVAGSEAVHALFTSDMDLSGRFTPEWLIVTDRHAVALSETDTPPRLVPLADVTAAAVREVYGSSFLILTTAAAGVEMIRCSKREARRLADMPPLIEQVIRERIAGDRQIVSETGRWAAQRPAGERCSKCGATIPRWAGSCPRCLDKAALLTRLLREVLPYWPHATAALALLIVSTFLTLTPPPLDADADRRRARPRLAGRTERTGRRSRYRFD